MGSWGQQLSSPYAAGGEDPERLLDTRGHCEPHCRQELQARCRAVRRGQFRQGEVQDWPRHHVLLMFSRHAKISWTRYAPKQRGSGVLAAC